MSWIDIEERKPEMRKNVLLTDGVEVFEGSRDDSWDSGYARQSGGPYWLEEEITHWMPLPKPPARRAPLPTGKNPSSKFKSVS